MDVIRRTDLERLALQGRGRCVSVFLPTHRAGPEVQQGPIRLKNLLRQAIQDLQADGVKAPMIHSILAPLRRLVNDGLFWQYQSDGSSLVLALSQHQIRLLEGTRNRLEEVHLPGIPLGVRDALQGAEAQKQLQLYVADRGGVAARGSSTVTGPRATSRTIRCSGTSARSTGPCGRS